MSCQVKLSGRIENIVDIREILYGDQLNSDNSWLISTQISASPTGDIIVFAHETNLVVASSKWDNHSNSLHFVKSSFRRNIASCDVITATICLPIVGQSQSSQAGPDWTCIAVGFESGFLRFYTEDCQLLFEEQFHDGAIQSVKCQSQHSPRPDLCGDLKSEELYVAYKNTLCVLAGPQVVTILRNCRTQLAKDHGIGISHQSTPHTPSNPFTRKWSLSDQAHVTGITTVGLDLSTTFDHLLAASTAGGWGVKYRTMPPHHTVLVGVGGRPYVAFHYGAEGVGGGGGVGTALQPVLSDVARAVVGKFKSALPSWLSTTTTSSTATSSDDSPHNSVTHLPAEPTTCRFGLCDVRRVASGDGAVTSPCRRYLALPDQLGRVSLVCLRRGLVLRMFKGYRDVSLAFIPVAGDVTGSERRHGSRRHHHHGDKTKSSENRTSGRPVGLFLVIYSRKRSILDIYNLLHGIKVCSFTAHNCSRLLYITHGLMGFQTTTKSKYQCQYTCVFLDHDGAIKEILIPFHLCLPEKSSERAKDSHLYKRLKHAVKESSQNNSTNLLEECLNTCEQVVIVETKLQIMELLSGSKMVAPEIVKSCADFFIEQQSNGLGEEKLLLLRNWCEKLSLLADLFVFVRDCNNESVDTEDLDNKNGNFAIAEEEAVENNEETEEKQKSVEKTNTTSSSLTSLPKKQLDNLQRLLDLSTNNDENNENVPLRVKFASEDKAEFTLAEMVSYLDLHDLGPVSLAPITSSLPTYYPLAHFLFHHHITSNSPLNSSSTQNYIPTVLSSSPLSPQPLLRLLLSYWLERPLSHSQPNLERSLFSKPNLERSQLSQPNLERSQPNLERSQLCKPNLDYSLSCQPNIEGPPASSQSNLEQQLDSFGSTVYQLVATLPSDVTVAHYSDVSPFWQLEVRGVLGGASRPFPALMAALLSRGAAARVETEVEGKELLLTKLEESTHSSDDTEDIWEKLTQENCEWGLLIGQLEDVSLLDIVLSKLATLVIVDDADYSGKTTLLPKLYQTKCDVSLDYILQEGKGAVSVLVAKWLTQSGIHPDLLTNPLEKDGKSPIAIQHFDLLKTQFPHSLETAVLLANICWEYSLAWQKNISDINLLEAAMKCLTSIDNCHIRVGLYNLLWNTHLKVMFENTCKLINKVGKLPKELLCRQDTGLSDNQITLFIQLCSDFFTGFMDTVLEVDNITNNSSNTSINAYLPKYEELWQSSNQVRTLPLVELSLAQGTINYDLLLLHHQLTVCVHMMTTFGIKHVRMISNLFDVSVMTLFFVDFQQPQQSQQLQQQSKLSKLSQQTQQSQQQSAAVRISWGKCDCKVMTSRMTFLTKVVTASVETIAVNDGRVYCSDHVIWMSRAVQLSRAWLLDVDVLRRFQIVELYSSGVDSLAEELLPTCSDRRQLSPDLLVVAGKRLSRLLTTSRDLGEKITAFSTTLTSYLNTLSGDWCSPATLEATLLLIGRCLECLEDEDTGDYKLATLMKEACTTLLELQ